MEYPKLEEKVAVLRRTKSINKMLERDGWCSKDLGVTRIEHRARKEIIAMEKEPEESLYPNTPSWQGGSVTPEMKTADRDDLPSF